MNRLVHAYQIKNSKSVSSEFCYLYKWRILPHQDLVLWVAVCADLLEVTQCIICTGTTTAHINWTVLSQTLSVFVIVILHYRAFSVLTLLVRRQEGHLACKNWVVDWWGGGMVVCLGWGADLHIAQLIPLPLTISCSSKSKLVLPFWYQLTQVVPDKGPLNGCCCCIQILTRANAVPILLLKYNWLFISSLIVIVLVL